MSEPTDPGADPRAPQPRTLRRRVYVALDPKAWPRDGLSPANVVICVFIVLASITAILETEPAIYAGREALFYALELVFVAVFLAEYVLRQWTIVERPGFGHPLWGRLRYAFTFWAIIDLLAILPALLVIVGPDFFLLRTLRLLRIMRLARLGRFSSALAHLSEAVMLRRYELIMSVVCASLLLVFSSALLYVFEGPAQPEAFGSIPRAMWWSVVTLTTVGYGDAYPVTLMGRVFAAITAIAGIGLIAMPTGILASAFSDVVQRSDRKKGRDGPDA